MKVVENAEGMRNRAKIDLRLFEGFSNRRLDQRFISGLLAAAGKRDVAAPRITLVLRSLDEKELGLVAQPKPDQHSDSSPPREWVVHLQRCARRKRRLETRDPLVSAKAIEQRHTAREPRCFAKKATVSLVTDSSVGVTSVSGCFPPNE